jgi:hypothetical protein
MFVNFKLESCFSLKNVPNPDVLGVNAGQGIMH